MTAVHEELATQLDLLMSAQHAPDDKSYAVKVIAEALQQVDESEVSAAAEALMGEYRGARQALSAMMKGNVGEQDGPSRSRRQLIRPEKQCARLWTSLLNHWMGNWHDPSGSRTV